MMGRAMKPFEKLLLPAVLYTGMAVAACGMDDGKGHLALKIHYNASTTVDGLRTNPPPEGEAPDDITDYRICVSAENMKNSKCENFNRADNPTGAKLGGLKPGDDRTVTFQGYDVGRDYEVRWCGNVSGVEVKTEKTTQVSMYISVCGDFTPVRNPMSIKRAFHTSTLLPDGRVLITGGFSNLSDSQPCTDGTGANCHILSATSSIDIYDPSTGEFEPGSGMELKFARGLHTATLLPDGKVLVAGGAGKAAWRVSFAGVDNIFRPVIQVDASDDGRAGASAGLIDPLAKSIEEVPMTRISPRADHSAIPFSNGDVLLVGGIIPATNLPLDSIGRYLFGSNSFENILEASYAARQGMAVAPFGTRSFLIWGGNHANGPSPDFFAEILREIENQPFMQTPLFVTNAESSQGDPAFYAAAAQVGENLVLTCGGMIVDEEYDPPGTLTDRVRIINSFRVLELTAEQESFVEIAGEKMNYPRAFHSATTLSSSLTENEVLVAGGLTFFDATDQEFQITELVEFFSPADLKFEVKQIDSISVSMMEPRAGHAVTELLDGTLLVTGGLTPGITSLDVTTSAEIYNPAPRTLRVE